MSTLATTNIKHASSSSNNIVLGSDGSTSISGHIIQVVSTTKTDTSSSTSTSLDDIPGLSLAITPDSTSSKILLMCSINLGHGGSNAINFNWVRGSTTLAQNDTTGTNPASFTMYSSGSITIQDTISNQFLDSPTYTLGDTLTYKLQWRGWNSNTRTINVYSGGTYYHGVSTITLMELAA